MCKNTRHNWSKYLLHDLVTHHLIFLIVLIVESIKAFFLHRSRKCSTFAPQFKISSVMKNLLNRALAAKKRLIYLLILAASIVAVGCSNNEPTYTSSSESALSVIGHTYKYKSNNNYISYYFAASGTCTYTYSVNGEFFSTSNLIYRIDDNNVDVYTDNSSNWQESKRNMLLYHLVYLPSSDALTWESLVFNRVY